MRLKDLKQAMLIPDKEYIINKMVNVRGEDILILSFTIEKDKNFLWTISEKEEFNRDKPYEEYVDYNEFKTNREELVKRIEMSGRDRNIFIEKMVIQDQIIEFGSSKSSHIDNFNREGIMMLQHFVEKGLISEEWDEVELENILITEYEQMEGGSTPIVDMNKELNISLEINEIFIEIPIQCSFKAELGKEDIGRKIIYFDQKTESDNYFFINEIYSFDPYEDIKTKMEEIEDLEIRENTLNTFIEILENVCPRDKNLAVIKFETPDNVQLSFNLKDYLDSEPITSDGSSASAIIWSSREKGLGINGYKLQERVLQPIDKDFQGDLELELTSRFLRIPGQKINI